MVRIHSRAASFSRWAKGALAGVLLLLASFFPPPPAARTASPSQVRLAVSSSAGSVVSAADYSSPPSFIPFTDLDSARWAEPAVDLLTEQGVVHGLSATTFAPGAQLTGEAAVTLLWRLFVPAGASAGASSIPGVDSWAQAAASWAIAHGVILHSGRFGGIAQSPAPRQQVVAWMVRTLGLTGSSTPSFHDAAGIGPEYAPAVGIAQSAGIVGGDPDGNFNPSDPITRAQMAVLLVNAERAAALSNAQSTPISWQPDPGAFPPTFAPLQILPLAGTARLGTTTLAGGTVEAGVLSLNNATMNLEETFLQVGNFGAGSLSTFINSSGRSQGSTEPVLWQGSSAGGTIWAWDSTPGVVPPLLFTTYSQGTRGITNFSMPSPANPGIPGFNGAFQAGTQNGNETVTDFNGTGPAYGGTGQLTGPVLPPAALTGLETQVAGYLNYSWLSASSEGSRGSQWPGSSLTW